MSSATVVHVQNISHQTSDKEVRDFFSFCGKITSLSVDPSSDGAEGAKSATVTFEKESAAKTALLLDNTQLGPSQVHVTSAAGDDESPASATGGSQGESTGAHHHGDDDEVSQDDKPRSRIVAEYLAHGYALSDTALQRAIALDKKHGVSDRFLNALNKFDEKYKATDKAKGIDASYGITDKAATGWNGLTSYFEKALGTPTGQRLVGFYSSTDKQVRDIHSEARRLADLKSGKSAGGTGGGSGEPVPVAGTEKTVCKCGGDDGDCPCAEGKCACSGCGKSSVGGEHTATGAADTIAASTNVDPFTEKS